jgi:spore coat polysaccharide biosynthesis predicted glycosyltransferase SpsG
MLAICVEASHQRGMGHLFRVLNFCETLIERGMPFRIFINPHASSQALLIQRKLPFESVVLDAAKNDWQAGLIRKYGIKLWIDDRLNTDIGHAAQVKDCGIPLVTFDDRGTGAVLADLNVMALAFDESEPLQGAKVLRGPQFLVLNHEIEQYRRLRTAVGSIVVTMGGSDTYGVTVEVVKMLKSAGRCATVIVGPAFAHETELVDVLDDGFVLKRSVPSLIEEFSHHALAITGGGITPFEANASGLPCIVIANEDFEISVGQGLARLGGSVFAGHYSAIDEDLFACELPIREMSEAAMAHIDLQGAARVADEIEALI